MILNEVQKITIEQLPIDESYTIGGVAVGENKRYEVSHIAENQYKVSVYDLLVWIDTDYFENSKEVIRFIENT